MILQKAPPWNSHFWATNPKVHTNNLWIKQEENLVKPNRRHLFSQNISCYNRCVRGWNHSKVSISCECPLEELARALDCSSVYQKWFSLQYLVTVKWLDAQWGHVCKFLKLKCVDQFHVSSLLCSLSSDLIWFLFCIHIIHVPIPPYRAFHKRSWHLIW